MRRSHPCTLTHWWALRLQASNVGARKQSCIPGRWLCLTRRLSPFPEISALSQPVPLPPHPPLTHHVLRGDVRPRLDQRPHHLRMAVARSEVQRRVSILRRAPLSAPDPCAPPGPRPTCAPLCGQTATVEKPHRVRTSRTSQFQGRGGGYSHYIGDSIRSPDEGPVH
jgi:hypothetical protein